MKYIKSFLILTILLISNITISYSQNNHDRPDYHAPITIMNDHSHKKGEFMTSYRYSEMKMSGLKNGSSAITNSEALSNYMMIPKNMRMKMHMLGLMYGLTDKITLMMSGSIIDKEMQRVNSSNATSKANSKGYGDLKLGSIVNFYHKNNYELLANASMSIPTGSINKQNQDKKLPYSMQIGSGSYDMNLGFTHKIFYNKYSFGNQISGLFRLNNNDNGYKFGDQYNLNSWASYKINNYSISARVNYQKIEAIEGKDIDITKMMIMMPTQDPALYKKEVVNFAIGTNYIFTKSNLKGNRLAIEIVKPLYQKFKGVQMKSDYKIVLGWQKLF